jgi:Right handed beta helix region
MKLKHLFLMLAAAAISTLLAQGPLTPPGAPAPTMKSLDQVEPRTAISSLPFTINQSGSYFLTRNLNFTAASGNAITIAASHVTVDLMGFTLTSANAVTGDAIHINGTLRNITVKNGMIEGNTTVSISGTAPNRTWTVAAAGFSSGINAVGPQITGCHFSQLQISGCRVRGLYGAYQATAEQVTATQNGDAGIELIDDGSVTNCTAYSNGEGGLLASGGRVANSVSKDNGAIGIRGSAVANCTSEGNGSTGITATSVANCTATSNATTGISGSTVANCTASSNGGSGISTVPTGSVSHCLSRENGGSGIVSSGGSITNSIAVLNGNDGISVSSGVVAFCAASSNNTNNNGSTNIDAGTATRTGNSPTP